MTDTTLAQRLPGCPDCKTLGPDLSACTKNCTPREWLIKKGGYFYRQNFCGYTTAKFEAGRYTEQDARREAAVEPWHMKAIHQDEVPDDLPSRSVAALEATITRLTADNKALTTENEELSVKYSGAVERALSILAAKNHWHDKFRTAEAKLAKVDVALRSMEPHVRAIRNAVRINDEWGRVVQGQTLAATALAEIFDAFLASSKEDGR